MAEKKSATTVAKTEALPFDENIISSLVLNGDLSKLSQVQKVDYYRQFCERLGLDPLSQPFKLLKLNGKEVMYCDRSGAQQLNKLHKVSHEIKARETMNGCYVVTARASTPDGRHTESIGAVTIDNLRGDALCNAMMKGETKAKRRSTLDLLGLSILDETETDTIPNAVKIAAPAVTNDSSFGPGVGGGMSTDEHMAQQAKNKISAFKKKYESADEISKVLADVTDVKDIANLYYINAELVESNPELKASFSEKKNQFFSNNGNGVAA
jgi:hypothetical protein